MNAPYQAMENESCVNVTFGVMSGELEREVAVELSFLDGTAVSKSLKLWMFQSPRACDERTSALDGQWTMLP
jgi:hypothetical protein